MARSQNATASVAIRSVKSPNCWPRGPTRCGRVSAARPGIARIKLSGRQFEAPNTKLMGPVKWSYFYLHVILDVFSRRVVGWRIEHAESATLFKAFLKDVMAKHAVPPDQLTLHADRGAPPLVICWQITAGQRMKAKATALMRADLGVIKSHSRPHISNDNPFSEAQFKTLKYRRNSPKGSRPSTRRAGSAAASSFGITRTTTTQASA